MSGPARHGAIVYARDVRELAAFYQRFFGMTQTRETPEFIALDLEGLSVIVHEAPVEFPRKTINTVKLFLTVPSLKQAREQVVEEGGAALEGEWSNAFFRLCNIADPEGNHIQIREFVS
ncbi:MAG: VOC family protein [Pseudomonadota bacterium]